MGKFERFNKTKDDESTNTKSVTNLKQKFSNLTNELFDTYITNKLLYSIKYDEFPNTLGEVLQHVMKTNNHGLVTRNVGDCEFDCEFDWSHDFSEMIYYKDTPLYFRNKHNKNEGYNIRIYTINTQKHIDILNEFLSKVDMIKSKNNNEYVKNICVIPVNGSRQYATYTKFNKRTFDDVFITNSQKEEIKICLDNFLSKREWYKSHNIPYHFGIILHGVPGCGKTALAQAISDYTNSVLYSLNGDKVNEIDIMITDIKRRERNGDTNCSTLLIDDIDCADITKNRSNKASQTINLVNDDIGTASLLNSFDGVDAPENIIYIFTTNHIDKLDPALIRPGRIDLSIELGYVCYETMNQFFNSHYGMDFPETALILDGLTFAKLQTYVMKGLTPEEFIKATTLEHKPLVPTFDDWTDDVKLPWS